MIRACPTLFVTVALGTLGCVQKPDGPGPASSAATEAASAAASRPQLKPEDAEAIAKRVIIVDGHIDLPYRLHEGRDTDGKLTEDPNKQTAKGDMDLVRAKAGGLDAPFMSIYIPAKYQETGGAKALADQLIDMVEGLAKANPKGWAVAKSPADVEANFKKGIVSLPLGIENGAALEDDLANVKHFADRGVRYITLTHAKDNLICDSSYDKARTWKGLSPYGRKVVEAMNNAGIMIDIAHVSDDAFYQTIELTKVPVIASHSSCRHFTPGFERNMNDDMIKRLAKNGGVIMINFGSSFLSKKALDDWQQKREAMDKHREEMGWAADSEEFEAYRKDFMAKSPRVYATVQDVANHIDRVVELAGIDHVGLGSDFDGVGDSLPVGLKDVSQYPNLFRVLIERGYGEEDLAKIAGGNVLRVWRAVEAYAATAAR